MMHDPDCMSLKPVTAEDRPDLLAWQLNRAVHDCDCGALRKAQRRQDLQYFNSLTAFGLARNQRKGKR